MAFSGSGSGTPADPYQITTVDQLQEMKDILSASYKLMNDIDASSTATLNESIIHPGTYFGFLPVGSSFSPFTGNLDGNDKTISGLYINRRAFGGGDNPSGFLNASLFGAIENTGSAVVIQNFTMTDVDITGETYAAPLSSYVSGTSDIVSITGISISGTVTCYSNYGAGFVASCLNGELEDCDSSVIVVANTNFGGTGGGGLIGLSGSGSTYIGCFATGNVTGKQYIGGFCGQITSGGSTFSECYSTGTVTASGASTTNAASSGGFIAYASGAFTASDCYSTGSVSCTATGTLQVGGFVGHLALSCSIENCVSTSTVTANSSAGTVRIGGFIGYAALTATANSTIDQCYCSGNINATLATSLSGGGFIGYSSAATGYTLAISDSYSDSNVCASGVTDTNSYLGGFTGNPLTRTVFENCYSIGTVESTSRAGGFAGNGTNTGGSYTSCYWDTETSDTETSYGGTGKTTIEMKTLSTFDGWDFTTIWTASTSSVTVGGLKVWLSETGNYEYFDSGTNDSDSFELVIPSTDEIRWINSIESLLVGTAADEWKIGSNKLDTPLSPTNFGVKQQTNYGSGYIQSIRSNEVVLFVDFVGRKIREMTLGEDGQKYVSPDLTSLAEHITATGIVNMAYQKNPDSILWCVLGDGSLIGMVYDREQNVVAWFDCPMGDGVEVQSVCVTPGTNEDEVWLSVKRTIDGSDVVYIEKMGSRSITSLADCFFVDSGITTSVTATDTITGLDHLEGEKVAVLADGVVIYDGTEDESVVSGGEVTLPASATYTTVHVGLPFTSILQPMRIAPNGPDGASLGSITHIPELTVVFLNTLAAKYGNSESDLYEIDFSDPRWEDAAYITGLFSGDVVVSMPGGFSVQNPLLVSTSGPGPLNVKAIIANFDVTGR